MAVAEGGGEVVVEEWRRGWVAQRTSHMLMVASLCDSQAARAASWRSERDARSAFGAISGLSTGNTAGALCRMMLPT